MRFWGKIIRRWHWEWLAVLAAILFYGPAVTDALRRGFFQIFRGGIQNKIRQPHGAGRGTPAGYGMDFHKDPPWPGMRYSRGL